MTIFGKDFKWPVFSMNDEDDGVHVFHVKKDRKDREQEPQTGFTISPGEQSQLDEWLVEHNKTCEYYDDGTQASNPCGAIGGRLSYCFTPTGLGLITVVKCMCGEELNTTEFEAW